MSLADAIIYGDKSLVEKLLQQGADPNEVDEYGFRPLIEAAIVNKTDMAVVLLQHGAHVDQDDATGRTALHWAVENNNIALARLLLENKADPNHYTHGSQPILVQPLLRGHNTMKNLLYDFGAQLTFAQDYINTKLLAHRFELTGQVDIVNAKGRFIELNFEGFFLEFTLSIILQSLQRYQNNFAARKLRHHFTYTRKITDAFAAAAEAIKYQQYLINIAQYADNIDQLLNRELLIIPVAHYGHAITFVRFGDLFAKCDRGANSLKEGSINIYRVRNKRYFNKNLFSRLIYEIQTPDFIDVGYQQLLALELVMRIPLSAQITGNCSWANVEAAIPTILFLLMTEHVEDSSRVALRQCMDDALFFYKQWQEWDKDRALYDCLQSFPKASHARKASKAAILGAILFQSCHYTRPKDIERAEMVLKILTEPAYRYVLESYITIYWRRTKTLPGKNFIQLLDACGLSWY